MLRPNSFDLFFLNAKRIRIDAHTDVASSYIFACALLLYISEAEHRLFFHGLFNILLQRGSRCLCVLWTGGRAASKIVLSQFGGIDAF